MRDGAIFSGILHGVVILLLLMGLPDLFRRGLEPPPVIPIDIINISDMTRAQALKVKVKVDGPQEEPQEKPKPPIPTPVMEKEPDPQPEEKVEPEPEVAPEPEKTLEDLIPDEQPKKEEKPKDKPKEKPKKKKKKKSKNFMALLNNIDKTKSSSEGKAQPDQDESSTADYAANNISDVLSVTELDLIRRQLSQCWNVPAGAKDGKDLYVDIKVEMNPDATVRSATVVGKSGGNSSSVRAAADSALRAVRNPQCSPFKLPLDRYDQWKTIQIRFDPKHIL